MSAQDDIEGRVLAAVTATIADDRKACRLVMSDMPAADIVPFAGCAIAYVSNMVSILAAVWEVEPLDAWEMILHSARASGMIGMKRDVDWGEDGSVE